MLQSVRKHLATLVGRRTAHAAPTMPEGVDAHAVREALARFHEDAQARYARVFLQGQPLLATRQERPLFEQLAACAIVERLGPSIYQPCVRLFPLYGKFVATDLLSHREPDQVFSLMFEQVYLVRNMDVRPDDHVLELCLGSGVNSLFAAETAASVTGVDINPRALSFAVWNAWLNEPAGPFQAHEGSLFTPVEDQGFDLIVVNPPFELVPEGEQWFLHSDGGEDGLDVIRTILEETPPHLNEGGRFEIITWSPGTEAGPLLVDLLREAFPRHRLHVHVLDVGPVEAHLEPFRKAPGYDAYVDRLHAQGLTDVYFLFARAEPAATPGVEITHPEAEVAACDALADPWR